MVKYKNILHYRIIKYYIIIKNPIVSVCGCLGFIDQLCSGEAVLEIMAITSPFPSFSGMCPFPNPSVMK